MDWSQLPVTRADSIETTMPNSASVLLFIDGAVFARLKVVSYD